MFSELQIDAWKLQNPRKSIKKDLKIEKNQQFREKITFSDLFIIWFYIIPTISKNVFGAIWDDFKCPPAEAAHFGQPKGGGQNPKTSNFWKI